MSTETQKSKMTIVGGDKVPGHLIEVFSLMVEQAYRTAGSNTGGVIINFLDDLPRNESKMLYSTFEPPNIISINLERHLEQMDHMARSNYMRASTVLWYEFLLSLGHELHHMLMEYEKSDDVQYDCVKAEKWAKKQVMALGFEHDIDPPEEWGTGISEDNMLSEKLSAWQHVLPEIDEEWAKNQQEMIDRNIAWLDYGIKPNITLDNFSDWIAIEGGWEIPVWKVRLENNNTTDSVPVVEEPVVEELVTTTEQSVPIEKEIDTNTAQPDVDESPYENDYEEFGLQPTDEIDINEEEYVVPQPAEEGAAPAFMTNPAVNPTVGEMRVAMYHTFMTIYNYMFEKCGWGTNGYFFNEATAICRPIDISKSPCVERVIVNYVNPNKSVVPTWPNGTISGLAYVGGTVPAVKLGIRTTKGNIITYTAIAQNPAKEGAWGKSAREGVKSMIVLRDDGNEQSFMAIRIIDGQFISNPLGLNGGKATAVTEESVRL